MDFKFSSFESSRSSPYPLNFGIRVPCCLKVFFLPCSQHFVAGGHPWSTYQRGQTGLSVFFLCFAVATLLSLLNLYPQIAGPSELFGDRIVLRTLFKTEKIYKKSVSAVELGDVANPRSGTKFSFVILKTPDGKPLRITSKFGSIPEMYLTLRAWLAQSNA
jgi:hypothetical protein